MFKKKCGLSFAKAARWYKSFSGNAQTEEINFDQLDFSVKLNYKTKLRILCEIKYNS